VEPPAVQCNGAAELCTRAFDQVAYAVTHNGFSNDEDGWTAPNQLWPMPTQLDDGVRGIMLDVHDADGVPHLCHGDCGWGMLPLVDGLQQLRAWLQANPREVITLIFEAYVSGDIIGAAFEESGLDRLVYTHAGGAWPTLGALVDADTRVVVLSDNGGAPAWYHDVWSHAFETHFSADQPEDFSCAPNRGDPANALFIFNHFLTFPVAMPPLARQVNFNPFLGRRAFRCQAETGRLPNFVTVDFYSIGDVLEVVDQLNGLIEPPPPPVRPLDDALRLNQVQVLGTHNSYHLPAAGSVPGDDWGYEMPLIADQLATWGVRQLELDINLSGDGVHRVFHADLIDDRTHCETLSACLKPVREFSESNPGHQAIFVMLEAKTAGAIAADMEAIEAVVVDAVGRDRLLTPDDVRRGFSTLRQAVTTIGWPTLGETRGKVVVVLLRDKPTDDAYLADRPSLQGRLFFLLADPDDEHAAIIKMDNPYDDIEAVAAQGFIIRTRADNADFDPLRRARAFESGAHIVSTDYPAPVDWTDYRVVVPDGAPCRCNPVTAPAECTATDVESL